MKFALVLVSLISVASSFGQGGSAPANEAEAAIGRLREGLVESFGKGDIDRLLTYLAPDVVVTWQNGEVCHGPAAVKAYYNSMVQGEHRIVREIKSTPEVLGRQINGDWAVSWGNLHDHFLLTDGRDLPLNTLFTVTTAKRGDRWLVTSYHASVNAFDNPVLALAIRKTALWVGIGGLAVGLILGLTIARIRQSGRVQRPT